MLTVELLKNASNTHWLCRKVDIKFTKMVNLGVSLLSSNYNLFRLVWRLLGKLYLNETVRLHFPTGFENACNNWFSPSQFPLREKPWT